MLSFYIFNKKKLCKIPSGFIGAFFSFSSSLAIIVNRMNEIQYLGSEKYYHVWQIKNIIMNILEHNFITGWFNSLSKNKGISLPVSLPAPLAAEAVGVLVSNILHWPWEAWIISALIFSLWINSFSACFCWCVYLDIRRPC